MGNKIKLINSKTTSKRNNLSQLQPMGESPCQETSSEVLAATAVMALNSSNSLAITTRVTQRPKSIDRDSRSTIRTTISSINLTASKTQMTLISSSLDTTGHLTSLMKSTWAFLVSARTQQ